MKTSDRSSVAACVERHQGRRGALIAVLEDIQGLHGYLPEDALRQAAEAMRCPLKDVYGVATFYRAFSLKPRGKHRIAVCLGTACHVRGAPAVLKAFERHLGLKTGETTSDGEITLDTVHCLGACALGPVVAADDRFLSKVSEKDVPRIVAELRGGAAVKGASDFVLAPACPQCGRSLLDAERLIEGRPAILLKGRVNGWVGRVWFSSCYGSSAVEAEKDLGGEEPPRCACPHCGGALTDGRLCPECEAPLIGLALEHGGALHLCSRPRCPVRLLEVHPVCTCSAAMAGAGCH